MAWGAIARSHGTVQVDALVRQTGWSRKRLWSRFSTQIGLSPKRAARLVRFEHATTCLVAGGRPSEVATVCGYVDQSYLHREVVSFAQCTPRELVAELGNAAPDSV
jgi:AraC-like DNA-binding protein